ncbi:hypothetical protein, partial [Neolewinella marina]|uniref:hypothetical protein n=1 Tax=Neolewinella marina TaxID=438751 RepID=UPI001C9DBB4C
AKVQQVFDSCKLKSKFLTFSFQPVSSSLPPLIRGGRKGTSPVSVPATLLKSFFSERLRTKTLPLLPHPVPALALPAGPVN